MAFGRRRSGIERHIYPCQAPPRRLLKPATILSTLRTFFLRLYPLWITLLSLGVFFFVLPSRFVTTDLSPGLDPSWQLSLHLAVERGLVFGRDFIFTYGPLGILSTRLNFAAHVPYFFLGDVLIYGTLVYVLAKAASLYRSGIEPLYLLLAATFFGKEVLSVDLVVILFNFLLFLVFYFLNTKSLIALGLAIVHALIIFYTKLNLGLAALGVFAVVFLFLFLQGERKKTLAAAAVLAVLLLGSAAFLHVDLPRYAYASLQIVQGYNDSMYLAVPEKAAALREALPSFLLFIAFCLYRFMTVRSEPQAFARSALALGFLFLIFKQSFVRADEHVSTYFDFAPLLLGIVFLFEEKKLARWMLGPLCLVSLAFAFAHHGYRLTGDYVDFKWRGGQRYVDELSRHSELGLKSSASVPATIQAAVAGKSVDIIPWDIDQLYFSGLSYAPRPVMQSYSAYTSYLDGKNAAFFARPSSPLNVLYLFRCIDYRYCFFDEAKTKRELQRLYDVSLNEEPYVVLQKRTVPREVKSRPFESRTGEIGKPFPLRPTRGLQYATIKIRYSLLGTLTRIFLRPPELQIRFRVKGKMSRPFRLIVPIAKGGVLVSRYLQNTTDAAKYFSLRYGELPEVSEFVIGTPDRWAFAPQFDYESELVAVTEPTSPQ